MTIRNGTYSAAKKLHLEFWALKMPPLFAMIAQQVALSADACFECCELARRNRTLYQELRQNPPVELYRSHRRVFKIGARILDRALQTSSTPAFEKNQLQILRKSERLWARCEGVGRIFQKDLQDIFRCGAEVLALAYREHLAVIREDLSGTRQIPTRAEIDEIFKNPECEFLFSVWFPCLLEYGLPFTRLLRRAASGKLKTEGQIAALEKLLRLDKYATDDKRIGRLYSSVMASGNKPLIKRLQDAHAGTPEPRREFSKARLKIALGAYLLMAARTLDKASGDFVERLRKLGASIKRARFKCTAPDVLRLFDSVAKDLARGEIDGDLKDFGEPHTFYMALKRDAKLWSEFERLSQKSRSQCEGVAEAKSVTVQLPWLGQNTHFEMSSLKRKGTSSS
jgi:hypothetical protein